jgi:hypothetical protein
MPRFRLPGEEHGRLVLIAQIAGFVVLLAGIAGFVMFAATGGNSAAPRDPAVPSITDAGEPAPVTTTEPAESLTPRPPVSIEQPAAAKKLRPKPAPSTPREPAPPAKPRPAPGQGGGIEIRDPWDRCTEEGAHAFTPRFHLPLVCQEERWRIMRFGDDGPGGGDDGRGDHDGPGRGGR